MAMLTPQTKSLVCTNFAQNGTPYAVCEQLHNLEYEFIFFFLK